jgi:tetratricopeptide (TPR) repeat protein
MLLYFGLIGAGLAISLLAAAIVVRAWKKDRAAQQLLTESIELEQAGDWRGAVERLEGYLNLRPLDDAERIRIARICSSGAESTAEREQAIDLLYRSLGTGIPDQGGAIRHQLAEHLLQCERWPEAEAEAGKLLEIWPDDARAVRIRALALARQYHFGHLQHVVPSKLPVLDWLTRAHEAHPGDLEIAELLATLLLDTELQLHDGSLVGYVERSDRARACWETLLKYRPCDPLVYLARYRFRTRWRLAGASEDLAQALLWGRGHPAVLLTAAEVVQRKAAVLLRQNRSEFEDAPQPTVTIPSSKEWPRLAAVHRLMRGQDTGGLRSELFDETAGGSLVKARALALRGECEAAEEMLLAGWNAYSPEERAEACREIVQQRLGRGDIDEARALLAEMVKEQPDNVPLLQLAAEVESRYDQAQRAKDHDGSWITNLP